MTRCPLNNPTAGFYPYHRGWIGVDLDGTLATYPVPIETVGEPIPSMVQRVKDWISYGIEVRIVTARVAASQEHNDDGVHDSHEFADEQRTMVENWCEFHIGKKLRVTAQKDFQMAALWDDRAVPIETNTGRIRYIPRDIVNA